MPILDSETLPNDGPYIELAALPIPIELGEREWPDRSLYEEHVFFELSDGLTNTLCSVTRSYLFFDPYEFTQFRSQEEIYAFVADVLELASRVASCPSHHFASEISIYEGSTVTASCRTKLHLKADLVRTLLFICEKSVATATEGKSLAIIGI